VRKASSAGTSGLLSGQYFPSNALEGDEIGLEEVDDDIWSIVYYDTALGRIDLENGILTRDDVV